MQSVSRMRAGNAFLGKGLSPVLYSGPKCTTMKAIWLDLKLAFSAIGIPGIATALKR
jgi:hypothetical protein